MTPTISILLPTVRPSLARRALSCLDESVCAVPYEVVVVADFDAKDVGAPAPCAHVRWIETERRGVVDAVNVACELARGDWWFLFNDESLLDPGALAILLNAATPTDIVTARHLPAYRFEYYGIQFAPFPFAHRDLLRALGGLLDPAYKAFYADPDLGLRAHAAGVPIRTIENAVICYTNGHDEAKQFNLDHYMASDQATFRARWDHLGAFHDC